MARERILLVDDDEQVLRGLRRVLLPMSGQWDMSFANSGAAALEVLAETPADVIVSDIRMPGMDGAELLQHVLKRHPNTIRIALSGQSERTTIVRAVGPTHQFLAKPCEGELLIATVQRACALRDALDSPSLKMLVAALGVLPSGRAAFARLGLALNAGTNSVHDVPAIVATDAAMAARVLQLVNSAFFDEPHPTASAPEAVSLLGPETIEALVRTEGAFTSLPDQESPLAAETHGHALLTARRARAIVQQESRSETLANEAMTAGLLHDIGRLVLAMHLPETYEHVAYCARQEGRPLWEVEQRELGATHAAVGAYLLGIWGLPSSIVDTAAHHHQPNESPGFGFTTLTAVHVADALDDEDPGPVADSVDSHYIARLGLSGRLPTWHQAADQISAKPETEDAA